MRDSILAYALLLSREFAPAAEVLRRLHDSGNSSNSDGTAVLLAWAYLETGQGKDATALLEFNPVPSVTGPGFFTPFHFPRIFELRARLAQMQGRTAEAEANGKLFAALSGAGGQ
jgi:hypothetical protein